MVFKLLFCLFWLALGGCLVCSESWIFGQVGEVRLAPIHNPNPGAKNGGLLPGYQKGLLPDYQRPYKPPCPHCPSYPHRHRRDPPHRPIGPISPTKTLVPANSLDTSGPTLVLISLSLTSLKYSLSRAMLVTNPNNSGARQ